jgi:methyltransferase (TIGR00027 family)
MGRAYHLLWDDDPKVFEDSFALGLSGCADAEALRTAWDALSTTVATQAGADLGDSILRVARSVWLMRSRYVEEELEQAIKAGVTQYVILGAGLDSFAYRRPDLIKTLHVFEVDYPATQVWKRGRLLELSIAEPSNVVFTPIDFQKESLVEGLRKCGYNFDAPGFFSWLGVTVYLSREATFDTLQSVAVMPRGSQIIFQYLLPITSLDGESRRMDEFIEKWVAARGEPYLTFFEPGGGGSQARLHHNPRYWTGGGQPPLFRESERWSAFECGTRALHDRSGVTRGADGRRPIQPDRRRCRGDARHPSDA